MRRKFKLSFWELKPRNLRHFITFIASTSISNCVQKRMDRRIRKASFVSVLSKASYSLFLYSVRFILMAWNNKRRTEIDGHCANKQENCWSRKRFLLNNVRNWHLKQAAKARTRNFNYCTMHKQELYEVFGLAPNFLFLPTESRLSSSLLLWSATKWWKALDNDLFIKFIERHQLYLFVIKVCLFKYLRLLIAQRSLRAEK